MSNGRELAGRIQTELSAFLRWWLPELRDIAESVLARVAPKLVTRKVIRVDRDGEPIGLTEAARNTRVVVVLPSEQVLRQDLVLPESIERDLDQVIALHLERDLPLARDQVCVVYSVVSRSREERRIAVRILVARRVQIEKVRERAQSCGAKLLRVGAAHGEDRVDGNFLQAGSRPFRRYLTGADKRLMASAAALAVCLIGTVMGQWVFERMQVGKEVQRVSEAARAADALSARLAREAAPAQALATFMHHPDATDVLLSLTASVPAHSWVYDLQITARPAQHAEIKLAGFSPAATALVYALEQLPQFQRVQLESAVSAGLGTAQDRLHLVAGWTGDGGVRK